MPTARIFQQPKTSTQSGRARTGDWVLEFEAEEGQRADPLTGWAGSGDTRNQLRLQFPDSAAAVRYAGEQGLAYRIIPAPQPKLKLQAYADNFR